MNSPSSLPRLVAPWHGISFPRLAETVARAKPDQIAFVDAPDTSLWLDRAAKALTYRAFGWESQRFARQLVTLGLKRGDTALFLLPNSLDFAVAFVGALAAGIIPVPLSLALMPEQIRQAADITRAQAIITISRLGELEPALQAREIAAQVFSIRAIASFGRDCPDGVVALDTWDETELDELDPARALQSEEISLITLEFMGEARALARTQSQLVAEAIALTSTAHIAPRAALLNTLVPGSAMAVIASVALPLLIRAQVHCHAVFSSQTLVQQYKASPNLTIIAPALLELGLSELAAELEQPLGSAILIQRLELEGARPPSSPYLHSRVVDVTAIGEAGHYFLPRSAPGRRAALPQNWRQPGTRVVESDTLLLQAKISEQGYLRLRGFGVPNRLGAQAGSAIETGLETRFQVRALEGQTFEIFEPAQIDGARNAA